MSLLKTDIYEGPGDRPLLIVHGLFGSARNFSSMARKLSDQRTVIVPDMRNHGESPRFGTQSYFDMADDLARLIDTPMDVIGHSMGGKAAMVLALTAPLKVASLLVGDIAPVAYSHTQLPLVRAMQGLDLAAVSSRRDADSGLCKQVSQASVRAFLLQSLDVAQKRWRLNLEVLGNEMNKIIGFPDVVGQYDGPTLFLRGGQSDYVQEKHHATIARLFPAATHQSLVGAGHWLHAEDPKGFEAACRAFLAQR
ncbi:MAG: alpha/beta fold hydrolase [Pseudomonadota bacterium]